MSVSASTPSSITFFKMSETYINCSIPVFSGRINKNAYQQLVLTTLLPEVNFYNKASWLKLF